MRHFNNVVIVLMIALLMVGCYCSTISQVERGPEQSAQTEEHETEVVEVKGLGDALAAASVIVAVVSVIFFATILK